MKAKMILCAICLVVVAVALTGCATTYQQYFEQVWLDKLMQYAAVLLGAVSAIAMMAVKVKKRADDAAGLLAKLGDRQNLLEEAQAQLAQAKVTYHETVEGLAARLDELMYDRDVNLQRLGELQETLQQLQRGLAIAFCNDPELVLSGHAKEIASLWEVEDEH